MLDNDCKDQVNEQSFIPFNKNEYESIFGTYTKKESGPELVLDSERFVVINKRKERPALLTLITNILV